MSQVKLLESRQVYFDVKFFKLKKKNSEVFDCLLCQFSQVPLKRKITTHFHFIYSCADFQHEYIMHADKLNAQ